MKEGARIGGLTQVLKLNVAILTVFQTEAPIVTLYYTSMLHGRFILWGSQGSFIPAFHIFSNVDI